VFFVMVMVVTSLYISPAVHSVPEFLLDLPHIVLGAGSVLLVLGALYVAAAVSRHVSNLQPRVRRRYSLALRVFSICMGICAALFIAQLVVFLYIVIVAEQDAESGRDDGPLRANTCGHAEMFCLAIGKWLPELIPCFFVLNVVWMPDSHRAEEGLTTATAVGAAEALPLEADSPSVTLSPASTVLGGGHGHVSSPLLLPPSQRSSDRQAARPPGSESNLLERSVAHVGAAVKAMAESAHASAAGGRTSAASRLLGDYNADTGSDVTPANATPRAGTFAPLRLAEHSGGSERSAGRGGDTAPSSPSRRASARRPGRGEAEGGTIVERVGPDGAPLRGGPIVWTRTDASSFSTHRLMVDDAPAVLQLCLAVSARHVTLPVTHGSLVTCVEKAPLPTTSELAAEGGQLFQEDVGGGEAAGPRARAGHSRGDTVPFRLPGDPSAEDLCRFVLLTRSEAVAAAPDIAVSPAAVQAALGSTRRRSSTGDSSAISAAAGSLTSSPGVALPAITPPQEGKGDLQRANSTPADRVQPGTSAYPHDDTLSALHESMTRPHRSASAGPQPAQPQPATGVNVPQKRLRRRNTMRSGSLQAGQRAGRAAFALLMRVECPLLHVTQDGDHGPSARTIAGLGAVPTHMRCGVDDEGIVHVAGMAFRNVVIRAHLYAYAGTPDAAETLPLSQLPTPPVSSVVHRGGGRVCSNSGSAPAGGGSMLSGAPGGGSSGGVDGRSPSHIAASVASAAAMASTQDAASDTAAAGGSTAYMPITVWVGCVEVDLATILATRSAHVRLPLWGPGGVPSGMVSLRLAALKRGLAERLPFSHPRSLLQKRQPLPDSPISRLYADTLAPPLEDGAKGGLPVRVKGADALPVPGMKREPSAIALGLARSPLTGGIGGFSGRASTPSTPLTGGTRVVAAATLPSEASAAALRAARAKSGPSVISSPPLRATPRPKKEADAWPPYGSRMTRWYSMTNKNTSALLVEETLREASYVYDVPAKYLQLALFQKVRMLRTLQADLAHEGPDQSGSTMPLRRPAAPAARAREASEEGCGTSDSTAEGRQGSRARERSMSVESEGYSDEEGGARGSHGPGMPLSLAMHRRGSDDESLGGGGAATPLTLKSASGDSIDEEVLSGGWGGWGGVLDSLERDIRDNTDRTERVRHLESMVASLQAWVTRLRAAVAVGHHGRGPRGETFKRSTRKADPQLAFLPLNLHVQEMRVRSLGPAAELPCSVPGNDSAGVDEGSEITPPSVLREGWYYNLSPHAVASHGRGLNARAGVQGGAGGLQSTPRSSIVSAAGASEHSDEEHAGEEGCYVAIEHAVRRWEPFGNWPPLDEDGEGGEGGGSNHVGTPADCSSSDSDSSAGDVHTVGTDASTVESLGAGKVSLGGRKPPPGSPGGQRGSELVPIVRHPVRVDGTAEDMGNALESPAALSSSLARSATGTPGVGSFGAAQNSGGGAPMARSHSMGPQGSTGTGTATRRRPRRIGSILAATMAAEEMSHEALARQAVAAAERSQRSQHVAATKAAQLGSQHVAVDVAVGAGGAPPMARASSPFAPPPADGSTSARHRRTLSPATALAESSVEMLSSSGREPGVGIEGRAHGGEEGRGRGNAHEIIYDTITVGAFAAHALGFKAGGLRAYVVRAMELRSKIAEARRRRQGLRRVNAPESKLNVNHLKRQLTELTLQLELRSDVIMAQALTAAVTAFTRKVRLIQRYMPIADGRKLLDQYMRIGFLLAVQSLLSTIGSEVGMLEDFERAVSMLSMVQFRLVPPIDTVSRGGLSGNETGGTGVEGSSTPDGHHVWMSEWQSGDGGAVRLVRYATNGPGSSSSGLSKGGGAAAAKGGSSAYSRTRTVVELRLWPMSSPEECAAAVNRVQGGSRLKYAAQSASPSLSGLTLAPEEDKMTPLDVQEGWTDPRLIRLVPRSLRRGYRISITPVILTQGINEMQTLASMNPFSQNVKLQTDINEVQYQQLTTYYTRYKVYYQQETEQVRRRLEAAVRQLPLAMQRRYLLQLQYPAPTGGTMGAAREEHDDTTDEDEEGGAEGALFRHEGEADVAWDDLPHRAVPRLPWGMPPLTDTPATRAIPDQEDMHKRMAAVRRLRSEHRRRVDKTRALDMCMAHAGTLTSGARQKQTLPVYMSNMVVRMMHGAYVMSCKSAKDRTSMGVTYQQAIMLSVYHHVGNFHTLTIAELMRRHGVRRLNAEKNIGIPKYAFSSFQAPFLPKELQPPPGTGGGGVTS